MTKPNPNAWIDCREHNRKHFFERCLAIHGNKFDYSQFVYVKAKTKGIIVCPDHGPFFQNPDKHLNSKYPCPKCLSVIRSKNVPKEILYHRPPLLTLEQFVQRARSKYGDKYQYGFVGFDGLCRGSVQITCPIHGVFECSPPAKHLLVNNHTGCPKCGVESSSRTRTGSYDELVAEFKKIHGDRYLYPDDNRAIFVNRRSYLDIDCPKHGRFRMKAQKHLSGQRCWDCAVEDMIEGNVLTGGYCEELFRNRPELCDLPAQIYYLKLNRGQFYKIGITRNSVEERWKTLKWKAAGEAAIYETVILKQTTLLQAFRLEQQILKICRGERLIRPWSTELFSIDVLPQISHLFS